MIYLYELSFCGILCFIFKNRMQNCTACILLNRSSLLLLRYFFTVNNESFNTLITFSQWSSIWIRSRVNENCQESVTKQLHTINSLQYMSLIYPCSLAVYIYSFPKVFKLQWTCLKSWYFTASIHYLLGMK